MSNLTHFIDGTQVLSRAEILVQYAEHLTTGTIQYFLETKKPRSWVSAKNKYWYAKEDIVQLLGIQQG